MTRDAARLRTVLANRHEVLRSLDQGPATKPELVGELDAARSTVDRAIRDLTEVGCVEPDDGRYRPTTAGRLALAEHDDYVAGTDAVHRATAFVNALPADSPPDVAMLRGCELTLAEPHAPEVALAPSIEVLDRATAMVGLAPVLLSAFPQLIVERVEAGGLSVEIVAQRNVIDSLSALAGGEGTRLLENDAVTVYSTDEPLPYALWVMETPGGAVAGITGYDDGGVHGVLLNDSDAAVERAREQYAAYRRSARRVEPR